MGKTKTGNKTKAAEKAMRPSNKSRNLAGQLPPLVNALLIFGTLAAVTILELRRPLRRSREDKLQHDARNLAFAVTAAATVSAAEKPVTAPLALAVHANRWGLLKQVSLPVPLEIFLSVVLLDYTLYLWHYLTHKVPFLWRFHSVHHADIDMDATTALRFHFGELVLSVPWRALQVRLLGISPLSLAVWQTLTLMEILFHHSNLRLPLALERVLCRLIVTPRMHGIHHSIVQKERDSNWSTIFSFPDYLHGTLRLNVPQQTVTIGVASYQDPEELGLAQALKLPFLPQRPDHPLERERQPLSVTTLAD